MSSFSFGFFDNTQKPEEFDNGQQDSGLSSLPAQLVPSRPRDFYESSARESVTLVFDRGLTLRRTTRIPSLFPAGYLPDHDVVSGKYEGGYKVWESSLDLVRYLRNGELSKIIPGDDLNEQNNRVRVLELGCGQGIPGIAALKGIPYSTVVFSDLNAEVLSETTWHNIHLNVTEAIAQRAACIAGDWSTLAAVLSQPLFSGLEPDPAVRFDLILSAETLYTAASCKALLSAVERFLSPQGVALLANKRYYFGLGGGTLELQNLLELRRQAQVQGSGAESERQHLILELVGSSEDGQSNIRDLLRLQWRQHKSS
jgi:SAM-dependent methyltransferase